MRAALVVMLAVAGCDSDDEQSSTLITRPRLLAIQAEPPMVNTGGQAVLRALVVDGGGAQVSVPVAWRVCSPWIMVSDPDRDCVGADALALDPAPDGSAVLDVDAAAVAFDAPTGIVAGPCDGVALSVIATAEVDGYRLLARKEVGLGTTVRRNPGIERVTLDGMVVERFAPDRTYVIAAAPVVELLDPSCGGGYSDPPPQSVRFHIYADAGELSNPHLDVEYLADGSQITETETFTAPSSRAPIDLWVVAIERDGGTAWRHLVLTTAP